MTGPDGRTSVLVVDDHAVVRSGLTLFLHGTGDLQVVGEAADGLLREVEARIEVLTTPPPPPAAAPKGPTPAQALRGRTWVTRRGVKIDRVACAWLIRRFIDPKATFRFVDPASYKHESGDLVVVGGGIKLVATQFSAMLDGPVTLKCHF